MISLASDLTDRKGRHARGWLFFDRDCRVCAALAGVLALPMKHRGLALAPLQDPRVAALLGIPPEDLMKALRFVSEDERQTLGVDALLSVMNEFGWARPLVWSSRMPGVLQALRGVYGLVTRVWRCAPQHCTSDHLFRA